MIGYSYIDDLLIYFVRIELFTNRRNSGGQGSLNQVPEKNDLYVCYEMNLN